MPRRTSRQQNNEGPWNPIVFLFLLWQFLGALVFLAFLVLSFIFVKCYKTCHPLKLVDSIFFIAMVINFLLMVLILNEMYRWTVGTLSVNRFLYSELAKMVIIFPLFVWNSVQFFSAENKLNSLNWWVFVLAFIPMPFFIALVIAVVVRYKIWRAGRRQVSPEDPEEGPLLAGEEEAVPSTTTPPKAAPSSEE